MESKMPLNSNASMKEEELRKQKSAYKMEILWVIVLFLIYVYVSSLYGLYVAFFQAKFLTVMWGIIQIILIVLSITAGAHRLWSHRCYKAKWPLRLFLMILQTNSYQLSIYTWCRNHRLHHKFTDTDADPHNSQRGFFFSHAGWLMVRKHPDVRAKSSTIDFSDLMQDPIVAFQWRWYNILMPIFTFILPTLIPYWLWGETLWCAWLVNMCKYNIVLNIMLTVNSVAHRWGTKPYDKTIKPADNLGVTLLALGEGWHNYHHTFPWDYRGYEFGNSKLNITTIFIEFCAFLGLAYDLKIASPEIIKQRVIRNNEITYINESVSAKEE